MALLKRKLSEFVLQTDSGVMVHPDYQGFAYSDGDDVEQRIYEGLRSAKDTSCDSEDLLRLISDWPTEYHFSRVRHNLLRHISIKQSDRVLELGAGCGSITRQLGETGADVTAIEGSHNRARCARERCRDLENVAVFCSNFQDVEFDSKFDVVTLIGVLEYSPAFINSSNPFVDCLRMVQRVLSPGGRLLIAIENQLGLKYFSGITEDHLAIPYAGIEDRYHPNGVRTLGQAELRRKILDAGFQKTEFQYPFPDYKLPKYVFFERAFTDPGFMPEEIIRHLRARDYSGRGKETIDLALAWPVVLRNGIAQALSNSFLIIASDVPSDMASLPADVLAVGYTMDRSTPYCTTTHFKKSASDEITVEKSAHIAHHYDQTGSLSQNLGVEPYRRGETLHSKLYSCAKRGDFTGVIACLEVWVKFLSDTAGVPGAIPQWGQVLPSQYIDCLPTNLVLTDDGLTFVDREWAYAGTFSIGSLALRYLTVLIEEEYFVRLLRDQGLVSQAGGIRLILERLNLRPYPDAYDNYIELHRDIDSQVFPLRAKYENLQLQLALSGKALDESTAGEVPQATGHNVGDIARNVLRSLKIW